MSAIRGGGWRLWLVEHVDGMSWTEVGAALDLHPQRASQIAKGVTGGRKT